MSKADDAKIRARFDRLLASYQKICVFLMVPALLGSFSVFLTLFNSTFNLGLVMSYVHLLRPALPEGDSVGLILISVGGLAVFVPLALLAAKGKLWAYYVAMAVYLADFVAFFFIQNPSVGMQVIGIAMHAIFLLVFGLGLFYYYRADDLLKKHTRAIEPPKE